MSNYGSYNLSSVKELNISYCKLASIFMIQYYIVGMNNLEKIDVTGLDFGNNTSLDSFFTNNVNLTTIIGLNTWDTPNITDMSCLFENCNKLQYMDDLSTWDTSKVINMSNMFDNCGSDPIIVGSESNDIKLDLHNWDISKVSNMRKMFSDSKISEINISGWDLSQNNNNISEMFRRTRGKYIDLSNITLANEIESKTNDFYYKSQCSNNRVFKFDDLNLTVNVSNWNIPFNVDYIFASNVVKGFYNINTWIYNKYKNNTKDYLITEIDDLGCKSLNLHGWQVTKDMNYHMDVNVSDTLNLTGWPYVYIHMFLNHSNSVTNSIKELNTLIKSTDSSYEFSKSKGTSIKNVISG